jgi:hypothetical protein
MIRVLNYFILFLCLVIPAAWWTRLNANYFSTKFILLFFVSSLVLLVLPRKIKIPKMPLALSLSASLIVIYQIFFHIYGFSFYNFLFIFEFLCLVYMALYFYSFDLSFEEIQDSLKYGILALVLFILSVSFYEFYQFRIVKMSTELGLISTFGNINMFAEFLVLTLPFIFFWTKKQDKIPNWFKLLLFSCWLFFIFYCRSRSAWIGAGLWLVLQAFYGFKKKEIAYIVLAFGMYFVSIYAPSVKNKIAEIKDYNVVARRALIEATAYMIKDNPLGIAPGRFMSDILPYQMETEVKPTEFSYYDQPHSELFKWPAQFGWVFSLISLVFLLTTAFICLRWLIAKKEAFLVTSFAVLLPQLLFQFPFENPASLLYLSLVLAVFFSVYKSEAIFNITSWMRVVFVVLFLAGLYNTWGFNYSIYHESTIPRTEKIVKACEYYPINFKTCHAKLAYFIDNKMPERFVSDYLKDLEKQPMAVDYLRLMPTYYSLVNNNKKTCQSLFLYKVIFPNQTVFDNNYYVKCKVMPDIFYFENAMQFKKQYINWLLNNN